MPPVVKDGKVVVSFKHTGDAPILKQSKFKVPANAPFQTVSALLRRTLGLQPSDPLVSAPHPRHDPSPHACVLYASH